MCRSLFSGALPEPVLSRDAVDQVSKSFKDYMY